MKQLFVLMAVGLFFVTATPGAEAEGTLERISERGSVNLGYREDRPPVWQ